jgi:hypothetical protein
VSSYKFQLFTGVFGASDEVLGSIESGVDFEKRIAQIYQNCRNLGEIKRCFDELQKEMEPQINSTLNTTRQKLLENFDQDVHDKLKISLAESKNYLNKYEQWLWNITRYYLKPFAEISESEYSFTLKSNPFSGENIHPGPYRIGKNVDDVNTYRLGHPLAQRIIGKCKLSDTGFCSVKFHYSGIPLISILEKYIGKSGCLFACNFTINSFETEDHVLLAAMDGDNAFLDEEECRRLFSLGAITQGAEPPVDVIEIEAKLMQSIDHKREEILKANADRNAGFFDEEIVKLDKWAEDKKTSLEIQLKELDKEIKFRKTEARKLTTLGEKVKVQKQIKEMEARRNGMRFSLFTEQDNFDKQKEELIAKIEAQMKQVLKLEKLFLVRWSLAR